MSVFRLKKEGNTTHCSEIKYLKWLHYVNSVAIQYSLT